MKIAKIVAFFAAVLVAGAYAIYVNSKNPGVAIVYNLTRASLISIILGIIAFFIALAIGRFIYELSKPKTRI